MDRVFDPPLTESEQLQIACEYMANKQAQEAGEKIAYAPAWVKLSNQQHEFILLDTDCMCQGENHHVSSCVEWDKEEGQVHITLWAKLFCWHDTSRAWSDAFERREKRLGHLPLDTWDDFVIWFTKWPGVIACWWRRFKSACKLFFTGYAEWEGGITFNHDKHIGDFLAALWWARRQCEADHRNSVIDKLIMKKLAPVIREVMEDPDSDTVVAPV